MLEIQRADGDAGGCLTWRNLGHLLRAEKSDKWIAGGRNWRGFCLEKLIQSIRVYDGKRIEIVWNFSDSYMKLLTGEEQNHEG